MKPGYFAIDLCLIPLAATAAPVATPYADNNGALAPASQYNGPLFKLSRAYPAKAGTPAMHRARGVIVMDREGFGYVRRRARLSTAWGQECLCHRGGLFPTSWSWNPTLTICGLAQDLAEKAELTETGAVDAFHYGPRRTREERWYTSLRAAGDSGPGSARRSPSAHPASAAAPVSCSTRAGPIYFKNKRRQLCNKVIKFYNSLLLQISEHDLS